MICQELVCAWRRCQWSQNGVKWNHSPICGDLRWAPPRPAGNSHERAERDYDACDAMRLLKRARVCVLDLYYPINPSRRSAQARRAGGGVGVAAMVAARHCSEVQTRVKRHSRCAGLRGEKSHGEVTRVESTDQRPPTTGPARVRSPELRFMLFNLLLMRMTCMSVDRGARKTDE